MKKGKKGRFWNFDLFQMTDAEYSTILPMVKAGGSATSEIYAKMSK
jgi:hypothetical protein